VARPRLSERAQQRALRQQLHEHGNDHAAIAAEFARQYRMRPRKAWRHAYGWTLREAATRINDLAAQDGLDPLSRAGMTAAHLCEYEDWPGEASPGSGREPTGRKPTAYILSLLARAYSTTVPSLVDETDQAWLPPADPLGITPLAGSGAGDRPTPAGGGAAAARHDGGAVPAVPAHAPGPGRRAPGAGPAAVAAGRDRPVLPARPAEQPDGGGGRRPGLGGGAKEAGPGRLALRRNRRPPAVESSGPGRAGHH